MTTEYGVVAARAALRDAGVYDAAAIRSRYPGFVAGATFADSAGRLCAVSQPRRVCQRFPSCRCSRTRCLAGFCDVALVIGADTTEGEAAHEKRSKTRCA